MQEGSEEAGYRTALGHPIVRRLWAASAISLVGDYVGLGALLLLAQERSGGRIIGAAAIFAVQAGAALLTGILAGPWLDRLPRRDALVWLQLIGVAGIMIPVVLTDLAWIFLSAGVLGVVRAATTSVRAGAMAEGVPDRHRGPLIALLGTTDQGSQVLGFLTGATLAVLVEPEPALMVDAASFAVGAVILSRMSFPKPSTGTERQRITAGIRDIFRNPVLAMLAPLVWVTATVGALPEALAPGITGTSSAWAPFVLASAPAGQATAMLFIGRTRHVARPSIQMTHLAWLALALGIAAMGTSPAWFTVTNFLVGSGVAWVIGPQLTFVRLAPPRQMAAVTGTMVAGLVAAEGIGTPIFGLIADGAGVAAAYRVAGFVVLGAAVLGWLIKERTPAARELDEEGGAPA